MARQSAVVPKVEAVRCESCGAPWEMRGFANTKTVACENCGSIFDHSKGHWQLIQRAKRDYDVKPAFPLGTRGELDGIEWEIIGWMRRAVNAYGERFTWEEHLLFNPYQGYRYLIFSSGHFCFVDPLPGVPTTGVNQARYKTRTYRHFSTADAVVDEVLGEFPWEVRRGDLSTATDYVDPPHVLSSDESKGEINWSAGRYLEREDVLAAFGRPGRPLGMPQGVFPCQPNPHQSIKAWMLKAFAIGFVAWLACSLFYYSTRQNKVVLPRSSFTLDAKKFNKDPANQDYTVPEPVVINSMWSDSTIEVTGAAPKLEDGWVVLEVLLVNQETLEASYAAVELDYSKQWRDGTRRATVLVHDVPNGKYKVQVRPYLPDNRKAPFKGETPAYITIKRDVPLLRYPLCTFFLLLIIPMIVWMRAAGFETARWAESDH